MDPQVLDRMVLAGARFAWMLKSLQELRGDFMRLEDVLQNPLDPEVDRAANM